MLTYYVNLYYKSIILAYSACFYGQNTENTESQQTSINQNKQPVYITFSKKAKQSNKKNKKIKYILGFSTGIIIVSSVIYFFIYKTDQKNEFKTPKKQTIKSEWYKK